MNDAFECETELINLIKGSELINAPIHGCHTNRCHWKNKQKLVDETSRILSQDLVLIPCDGISNMYFADEFR